jgi:3-oxoacyl-[acyl-carrier protein] reductase
VLARSKHTLNETVETLSQHGHDAVLPIVTDVRRAADVERAFSLVGDRFGNIDVLVCNAAIQGPIGPAEDADWLEWTQTIETNLYGVVLCCRAAVPIMRRQGRGKIITLSGGGATAPRPAFSAYAASKAAVVRFTETLANELTDTGIDVNAVAPGAMNTRLHDEILKAGAARVGQSVYDQSVRQKQEGGTPLQVGADLIAFLASEQSDGITGRLLSAVWDDWRQLPRRREQLAASDVYTLRRITPDDRGWGPA